MDKEKAKQLLDAANVFFGYDADNPELAQVINMNDVWGWACADGQGVKDEEMPEVARLFWQYGWCGILYWAGKQKGGLVSEFHDVNRYIEFVRIEEEVRANYPDQSERAYKNLTYKISG